MQYVNMDILSLTSH